MRQPTSYLKTGDDLFRPNELVYINKAYEQSYSHIHSHDFIEIAFVASGRGLHIIGDKEYKVSKGDLFVINYNILHEFRSLPDAKESPLYVYNCIFLPEFLDISLMNSKDFSTITHNFLFSTFFPEESENRANIRLQAYDYKEIENLFEKMHLEYMTHEHGYVEILRAYTIELLVLVFRYYHKNHIVENKIKQQRKKIILDVINYMKVNFYKELKLEDLSMMAFLSKSYFCKKFKEYTGMTVFEYAQKIRITASCSLLKGTELKIIDIAIEVGYSDVKFFNKVFKRYIGKTPSAFRKEK